ncbi:MAG: 3-isopropylmalate dehydratase [Desulfobacterota bacterium]|nr:3-isopropylmalate dehydratase [Thermodesulfobacteriota bacterium]
MTLPEFLAGRVWKLGDHVNTDLLHPPSHFTTEEGRLRDGIEAGMERMASVIEGDSSEEGWIIVAGENFGCGSSRESSVRGLKAYGIRGVVASSIARIFMRSLVNLGIPVFECREIQKHVENGDRIKISVSGGWIETSGSKRFPFSTMDPHLRRILEAGGLMGYLRRERDGI